MVCLCASENKLSSWRTAFSFGAYQDVEEYRVEWTREKLVAVAAVAAARWDVQRACIGGLCFCYEQNTVKQEQTQFQARSP